MCFETCDRYGFWNNNIFCKYAFTVKPVLMGHPWAKADSDNESCQVKNYELFKQKLVHTFHIYDQIINEVHS